MRRVLVAAVAVLCLVLAATGDPAAHTGVNPQPADDTAALVAGHHHPTPVPSSPSVLEIFAASRLAIVVVVAFVATAVVVGRREEIDVPEGDDLALVRAGLAPRPGPRFA